MSENMVCSVAVITYNHGPFIREALESILSQQTTFDFEVIISDDCSKDNTADVIGSYISEHPFGHRVKFFRQDPNIGMTNNFRFVLRNCKGKYIAVLEGDDYWTDPYKLQKQVDYLEKNPDCISCHHWQKYAVPAQDSSYKIIPAPKEGAGYCSREKTTLADIFANKVRIKTRTHMFRNIIPELPEWFSELAYGDVAHSMILGKYGNFGFIDEPMAVYRQTGAGVSTTGSNSPLFIYVHFMNWIKVWESGLRHYNFRYFPEGRKTIIHFYSVIFNKYGVNLRIYFKSVFYILFRSSMPLIYRLRIFAGVSPLVLKCILKRISGK